MFLKIENGNFSAAPATAQQQQQQQPILDLFGEELDGGATSAGASAAGGFNGQASTQKASDDLLQLAANPFASPTGATPPIPPLPANSTWSSTPQNGGPLNRVSFCFNEPHSIILSCTLFIWEFDLVLVFDQSYLSFQTQKKNHTQPKNLEQIFQVSEPHPV